MRIGKATANASPSTKITVLPTGPYAYANSKTATNERNMEAFMSTWWHSVAKRVL